MTTTDCTIAPRGLKGLVVADTAIGDVRGDEGFYHYRQYSAVELAEQRGLEDVWFLLQEGSLPDASQRRAFASRVAGLRMLPPGVRAALPAVAATMEGPLDGLRSALSMLAGELALRPMLDLTPNERARDALALCAPVPTLVAGLFRLAAGHQSIAPRADLGWAANYLYMLSGREATPQAVRAIEQYLVLTIDHGFNASTFTARVIASTGADLGACLVGALGAMSGPLHGGAPSRALDLLDEIGPVETLDERSARARIDDVVRAKLDAGDKIMGFGHAVYRTEDPRAVLLRRLADEVGGPLAERAGLVERRTIELLAEFRPERGLRTNVEYYAGVVMAASGIDPALFTPTFASSRVIGWAANALEQAADGKILRPSAHYVGRPAPQPVPSTADGARHQELA